MFRLQSKGRPLAAMIAAAGAIGGLTAMSTEIRMASADNTSVSTSASASSSSSSSSSATSAQKGGCTSEATASAEVTTTVNGKTTTVRRDDVDRGDGCSANAKAKAAIDGSQPEDSTAQ
jgi:hypothetical protein